MSLIGAVANMRAVFKKYAEKEGDSKTLSKAEVAELLRNELQVPNAKKAEVDDFFSALDADKDGCVSFQEFATFTAAISVILNPE